MHKRNEDEEAAGISWEEDFERRGREGRGGRARITGRKGEESEI